jgi:hypothetical protein
MELGSLFVVAQGASNYTSRTVRKRFLYPSALKSQRQLAFPGF